MNEMVYIYRKCPDVCTDKKKLNKYLLEFYPNQTQMRNLLSICVDVGIPKMIKESDYIGKIQLKT